MFLKSIFCLAFVGMSTLAVATPPACLIDAVNTRDNPAEVKSICQNHATDIQKILTGSCGQEMKDAMDEFASTCKNAGVEVASYTASATSGSASPTDSSSPATGTSTMPTSTNGSTTTPTASTATQPGASSSTTPSAGSANTPAIGRLLAAVAMMAVSMTLAL